MELDVGFCSNGSEEGYSQAPGSKGVPVDTFSTFFVMVK